MTALVETISDQISDRINPIVVKELRQAVNSWFVTIAIIVFLAIQVVVLAAYLILSASRSGFAVGGQAFALLQWVLVATCMLFIPVYTGVRLAAERASMDLMFVTAIRPRSIILGKLTSAIILTGVLFSATMPFLTFTYLLRGIDLPTIFLVLLMGFAAVIAATQISILWACLPRSMVLVVLTGLVLLLGLIAAGISVPSALWVAADEGIGSKMGTGEFWEAAGAISLFAVAWLGLFVVLAIAMISPPSANRMLPMRLFVTAFWLISGVVAGIAFKQTGNMAIIGVWLVNSMILFTVTLLITICERDNWGPRLLRRIPKSLGLRMLLFPWFTGWAGGMVWWVVLAGATVGYVSILCHNRLSSSDIEVMGGVAMYVYAYGGTALILRRVLGTRLVPGLTWLLVLALLFLLIVVPVVAYFLIHFDNFQKIDREGAWLVGLPAMLWERNYRDKCLAFSGAWSAVVLLITLPMAVRQLSRFHPDRTGPGEIPAADPEPAPASVEIPIVPGVHPGKPPDSPL